MAQVPIGLQLYSVREECARNLEKTLASDYPGRPVTVHLKPYSRKLAAAAGFAAGYRPLIGEDDVPWAKVFDLCEGRGGTTWYIVEYESDAYPPLDAVNRCLGALKRMGK